MVMKTNVECEIYISNMVNFFENNPNDLIDMIGDGDKQKFYDKIREYVYKNFENGEDVTLTQKQLIEIVLDLTNKDKKKTISYEVLVPYIKTKFGEIILN
jgi:hypothetical protein